MKSVLNKKNLINIFLHVAGWTAYLTTVVVGTTLIDYDFWVYIISAKIPVILLFYFCLLYYFPKYLDTKKYWKLIVSLLILNFVAIGLRFFIASFLVKWHFLDETSHSELINYFWSQLRLNLAFITLAFAFWYARKNLQIERDKKVLENEVLNAQLNVLKYQINPHFLYNTLSFLYAKSLPLSKELSQAIGKLSEIMRYSLHENNGDKKVSVEREVQHIYNFIEIHQLRFDDELHVLFTEEIQAKEKRIIPLILIIFVENAFKHGILNDPLNPVKIHLKVNENSLLFSICNKINFGVKERSNGIGLPNIHKRLELSYPEKHELIVNKQKDFYSTELIIQL